MVVRKRRVAAAAVAVVLACVGGFLGTVWVSALPDVSPVYIAIGSPDDVSELQGRGLRVEYEVDGIDFAGESIGTRQPGEYVVDWYAEGGLTIRQEVWSLGGPLQAWWRYRTENPRHAFERQFDDLVVDVEPLQLLAADSFSYFCGNAGRSRTDGLEDCQIWGFWARYGQYLIYIELRGTGVAKSSVDSIVAYLDLRLVDLFSASGND